MHQLPNGDIFAPRRGQPPDTPKGYIRDTGDSFLFHPILTECKYRVSKSEGCKGCSGIRHFQFCEKFNKQVQPGDCKECQDA